MAACAFSPIDLIPREVLAVCRESAREAASRPSVRPWLSVVIARMWLALLALIAWLALRPWLRPG